MSEPAAILKRKDEHLDLALRQATVVGANPFDAVRLEPCALPELALSDIDLRTTFLGAPLQAPLLVSSMTGGPRRGEAINARLAEAAEALGIGLAVGSQRVALEGAGSAGIDGALRKRAPRALLLANLGGAQLAQPDGIDLARRAVEMIGADGLIVHLNPLQEAVQPSGDTDWRGVLAAIEKLAATLGRPVVAKEVGFGLSAPVAQRLAEAGVAALDVAGAGGTQWALIEADRAVDPQDHAVGQAFAGWGLTTPEALREVRAACPALPLIGSGGVRNGVDAAKAIGLGADLVGQAGGVLQAALESTEAVIQHFEIVIRQLRIACFCAGARDLDSLRRVRLLPHAIPVHDL
ncbi:type 2 isopentenyl-diphosphate Delta-isomerase [Phenylobacterium sp.]|uniref:type 2 isopentenyl-diphosphate Delta-isomerase n=1 Tax=Phenylobacterium sp. TaxID=1871053 RepID=UPI0037851956